MTAKWMKTDSPRAHPYNISKPREQGEDPVTYIDMSNRMTGHAKTEDFENTGVK